MNGPRTIRGLLLAVALLLAANLIAMLVGAQNRPDFSTGSPTQHGGVVIIGNDLPAQSLMITSSADGATLYFWKIEAEGGKVFPKAAEARVFQAR